VTSRVLIGALALVTTACGGAEVAVSNHSSTPLDDVVISARDASRKIDRIDAGSTARRFLCPRGEAGSIDISFRANGQQHQHQTPLYFECEVLYRVDVDVSSALDVTASVKLR
jgi:hypothetical protein